VNGATVKPVFFTAHDVPSKKRFWEREILTPVGPFTAIASERGLVALEYVLPARQAMLRARLAHWAPQAQIAPVDNLILQTTRTWLDVYFDRDFQSLPEIPLDPIGTEFERAVWFRLISIPIGAVSTYRAVAEDLCSPLASRAVGSAIRKNAMNVVVPCHRVVGTDKKLHGYGGGLERKRWLLLHEGALDSLH
jgi:O-6-methylguanine DNA methyltransferase